MQPTAEDVRDWVGSDVVDAEGHELGRLVGAYLGPDGRPRWLSVLVGEGEVSPVPVAGAEPTGLSVRVAAVAEVVRRAPRIGRDEPLGDAVEEDLAALYGLDVPEGAAPSPQPPPQQSDEVVERLKEAYALEGEGLLRLEALMRLIEDDEARHDLALHAGETRMHRTGVEERLRSLDASTSTLRDAAHGARAAAGGLKEALRRDPVGALRDAEAFERREAAFYAELEELARAAGDTATADLAATHRTDEEAMAVRIAGTIPRVDSPA